MAQMNISISGNEEAAVTTVANRHRYVPRHRAARALIRLGLRHYDPALLDEELAHMAEDEQVRRGPKSSEGVT